MRAALSWIMIWMVRVYQACLSPYLGRHCKYYPTCSHYFIQAVQKHGPFRGAWKGLCRIARCHPFSRGGYDPVE